MFQMFLIAAYYFKRALFLMTVLILNVLCILGMHTFQTCFVSYDCTHFKQALHPWTVHFLIMKRALFAAHLKGVLFHMAANS